MNAFAASASQSASQHVKNSRAGSYGQKERGSKEDKKTVRVKHEGIVGIRAVSVNDARWEIFSIKVSPTTTLLGQAQKEIVPVGEDEPELQNQT
jgi:hypothetical protein